MTGQVISKIRAMAEAVKPDAVFECDEARMINVKIDTVTRKVMATPPGGGEPVEVSNSFIYLEEPTYGYYDIPYRGFQKQRTLLRIYFCKFEEMQASAYKGSSEFSAADMGTERVALRDEIEETMVRPFLYLLKKSEIGMRYPDMLSQVRVLYPRSRFDANEVSVGLEITYQEDWCLWQYAKPIPEPESDATITPLSAVRGYIGYNRGRRVIGELDQSDATAASENIDKGKVAYVNFERVIGSRPDDRPATKPVTEVLPGENLRGKRLFITRTDLTNYNNRTLQLLTVISEGASRTAIQSSTLRTRSLGSSLFGLSGNICTSALGWLVPEGQTVRFYDTLDIIVESNTLQSSYTGEWGFEHILIEL